MKESKLVIGPLACTTLWKIIPFTKIGNTKQEGTLCGKIMRFNVEAKRSVKYHKKQQKIESGALSYIMCYFNIG